MDSYWNCVLAVRERTPCQRISIANNPRFHPSGCWYSLLCFNNHRLQRRVLCWGGKLEEPIDALPVITVLRCQWERPVLAYNLYSVVGYTQRAGHGADFSSHDLPSWGRKIVLSVSSKRVLNVSVCHKPRFEVSSDVPLCHGHGTIQMCHFATAMAQFSLRDRNLHGIILGNCSRCVNRFQQGTGVATVTIHWTHCIGCR